MKVQLKDIQKYEDQKHFDKIIKKAVKDKNKVINQTIRKHD